MSEYKGMRGSTRKPRERHRKVRVPHTCSLPLCEEHCQGASQLSSKHIRRSWSWQCNVYGTRHHDTRGSRALTPLSPPPNSKSSSHRCPENMPVYSSSCGLATYPSINTYIASPKLNPPSALVIDASMKPYTTFSSTAQPTRMHGEQWYRLPAVMQPRWPDYYLTWNSCHTYSVSLEDPVDSGLFLVMLPQSLHSHPARDMMLQPMPGPLPMILQTSYPCLAPHTSDLISCLDLYTLNLPYSQQFTLTISCGISPLRVTLRVAQAVVMYIPINGH